MTKSIIFLGHLFTNHFPEKNCYQTTSTSIYIYFEFSSKIPGKREGQKFGEVEKQTVITTIQLLDRPDVTVKHIRKKPQTSRFCEGLRSKIVLCIFDKILGNHSGYQKLLQKIKAVIKWIEGHFPRFEAHFRAMRRYLPAVL